MVKDLKGGLYVDTRITFGGVAGCGSFGLPADAWKQIMESELNVTKVFRWVDDNLFVKKTDSPCNMKAISEQSVELGVVAWLSALNSQKNKGSSVLFGMAGRKLLAYHCRN
jgi:hypothetical protein